MVVDFKQYDHIVGLLCGLAAQGVEVILDGHGTGLDIYFALGRMTPEIEVTLQNASPEILAFLQTEQREMRELTNPNGLTFGAKR